MRKVLIVEDDHDTRVALREALEEQGFCVITAANGADGFRIFSSLEGQLVVVLDQNIPLMSGDEFLFRRLNSPRLLAVPVVVMSAVSDRSLKLGANAFLSKPLNIDALVQIISGFFDGGTTGAGSKCTDNASSAPATEGKKPSGSNTPGSGSTPASRERRKIAAGR